MSTTTEKQRIREAMCERLLHSPEKNLATESRLICKRLTELLPQQPRALAAFFPLKSEPDIRPFLREALRQGIELYLPSAGERSFIFRHVANLRHLRAGPWNIPEPTTEAPAMDPQKLHYTLVPGRAFDREGWRIGRGGAGYDRWIREQRSLYPNTVFWGVAFECQVLPAVPHTDHDERVDGIVTARGFLSPVAPHPTLSRGERES